MHRPGHPDIGGGDFVTTRQKPSHPRVRTPAVPALLPPRAKPPSSHLPASTLVRSIHTAYGASSNRVQMRMQPIWTMAK
jgi:hypothetical protein